MTIDLCSLSYQRRRLNRRNVGCRGLIRSMTAMAAWASRTGQNRECPEPARADVRIQPGQGRVWGILTSSRQQRRASAICSVRRLSPGRPPTGEVRRRPSSALGAVAPPHAMIKRRQDWPKGLVAPALFRSQCREPLAGSRCHSRCSFRRRSRQRVGSRVG